MNLDTLFKPRTLAVIGVSLTNEKHPANVIYNKNNPKIAGEGVGISMAVSIGNKALIRETDLLDYFNHDSETNVMAVEGKRWIVFSFFFSLTFLGSLQIWVPV